jgi:hypothetical protein
MNRLLNMRLPMLLVGAVFLAALLPGIIKGDREVLHGYLIGAMYWTGLSLGSLGLLMINHCTGGRWGILIRRFLEAAAGTLPLCLILLLPIVLRAGSLYEWAYNPDDHHIHKLTAWLNRPFFTIRFFFYFALWIWLAERLRFHSLRQDSGTNVDANFARVSHPGLLVFIFTATFAVIDWMMSLEPRWYSTMYGILQLVGYAIAALCASIVFSVFMRNEDDIRPLANPGRFFQLGKLLFALIMFFTYCAFSQYLLIWSANLSEEAPWVLRRTTGTWLPIIQAVVVLHFVAPFLILLSQDLKKNYRKLVIVAGALLLVRWLEMFWVIAPALRETFHIRWIEIAATLGCGGFWLWVFTTRLSQRRLAPVGDPGLAEASVS